MIEQMVRRLRRSMRQTDVRIKEYCSSQVPAEVSRYTLSQMRAIDTLYELTREAGGGIQLKLLANTLAITPAAASEMVDTLVRKGVIVRESDPVDRRAVRIRVSDRLCRRFEAVSARFDEFLGAFLRSLPPSEAKNFVAVSEKFADFADDPEHFPEVEP